MAQKNISEKIYSNALLLIILTAGLLWMRSSWGKVAGGTFVSTLGDTLSKFASKNPNPFMKDFLENTAIPNASSFGVITMWGEVFVALAIVVASALLIFTKVNRKNLSLLLIGGLVGGAVLNAIFYLAAGWTSPSTDGLNLLMFAIELVGIVYIMHSMTKQSIR